MARFDGRNPRAEDFLRNKSSTLIAAINEEQINLVRSRLVANMESGVSPRSAALDIVGRLNRATGKREGGIVGLNPGRIIQRDNARAELRSGDPARMANYLTRKSRNKTFDPIVERAIREGKPVPAEQATKIINRLESNLLRDRGNTIARTELLGSLHEAQDEGIRQLIDNGSIKSDWVTETWDAAEDGATRNSHVYLDNQTAGVGGVFKTKKGHLLRYPGDAGLGAPPEEIINCRCRKNISIDFLSDLQRGD